MFYTYPQFCFVTNRICGIFVSTGSIPGVLITLYSVLYSPPYNVGGYSTEINCMAQKRMFDRAIIETDNFLNISMSAKALYFLLGMEADDEGFVSPNRVLRLYGGEIGDIKNLIDTGLVIPFQSGVVVITHWNENNYLDKNRIKPTQYQKEKEMLELTDNKKYVLNGCSTSIEEYRGEERRIEYIATKVAPINFPRRIEKQPSKPKTDPNQPLSLSEFIEKCKISPQKHIQIIGEWAEGERPNNTTVGEWNAFIKRNLRAANLLKPYSMEKIELAYQKLQGDIVKKLPNGKTVGFITKYSLETVSKYIDLV